MPYVRIKIKLNNDQCNQFIHAIQNDQQTSIRFLPRQVADESGDTILVTKKQYEQLILSKITKKGVTITFSKAQLKHMSTQIGSGILDSISNFFKGAANTVKTGYNKVKNYVTGTKQPVNIEMKNMANVKTPKPAPLKDYGPKYDYEKPGYKKPEKSTFDKIASQVKKIDKAIDNTFRYPPNVNTWKQQQLGYNNNGFQDEGYF